MSIYAVIKNYGDDGLDVTVIGPLRDNVSFMNRAGVVAVTEGRTDKKAWKMAKRAAEEYIGNHDGHAALNLPSKPPGVLKRMWNAYGKFCDSMMGELDRTGNEINGLFGDE